ncbi:MAG: NUDIX hydrolase [Rhodoplanes sp.]|uniref:NUDIX hydrolase n=1 Tax=Rhodoplanes sp. TaxID=1968906 RepID=UPI00184BC05B|nr:NUDIX hydrolase [Rhodoplanes sp.]NVO13170.1 NUDIX hydrolase [Rhodoplanes sp.]
MSEARTYPTRPFLAVSAAVFRAGRVLLVRRAKAPSTGPWTLPGGAVETGETLHEAVLREVFEETALRVAPAGLAGHREVILHDAEGRVERHFVVLAFAARWLAGEPVLDAEHAAFAWHPPDAVAGLDTTEGLAEIVAAAQALVGEG